MKVSVFVRRFICLVLVCLTVFSVALAVSVDLSSFSNDEILDLLKQVNAELVTRGISKTAVLPKGAYDAGSDIPVGKYIFTCLATGDEWGNVTIYSEGGNGKQLLWNVVSAPEEGEDPETIFITLNDGDQLKSGVPFSLTIMNGIFFQ